MSFYTTCVHIFLSIREKKNPLDLSASACHNTGPGWPEGNEGSDICRHLT